MEQLHHLIYISRANGDVSEADLSDILAVSRRNNARRGITGMLLYSEGSFIQVLEGAGAEVGEVFGIISGDARHSDVVVLTNEPIARRDFPDWTMGFERVSNKEVAKKAGFTDFMDGAQALPECFRKNRSAAHALLLTFRNSTSLHRPRQ